MYIHFISSVRRYKPYFFFQLLFTPSLLPAFQFPPIFNVVNVSGLHSVSLSDSSSPPGYVNQEVSRLAGIWRVESCARQGQSFICCCICFCLVVGQVLGYRGDTANTVRSASNVWGVCLRQGIAGVDGPP